MCWFGLVLLIFCSSAHVMADRVRSSGEMAEQTSISEGKLISILNGYADTFGWRFCMGSIQSDAIFREIMVINGTGTQKI